MELNKINGNTYYIDNPTNIGVYAFKSKYCMLVDTGINNTLAAKFDEVLKNNGLKPKYIINTHNHTDHSGANIYFKEHHPGAVFYASSGEKIFIEDDSLFSAFIYGASPLKELKKKNSKNKGVPVDFVLEYGTNKINDEKFNVLSLKGHSIDMVGIATPDRVCFLGDSLFSHEIMNKHPFPFLFDIEDQLNTIEYIKTLDYDFFLLSHGVKIYSKEEISQLAEDNKKDIEKWTEDIRALLSQPLTREELLEQILILNDINMTFRDYYLCLSSAGAFITYLYNADELKFEYENGKLYYYLAP